MTSRSERDKALDNVLDHLGYMTLWLDGTESFDYQLGWNVALAHVRKGVATLMDDPKDYLE